MTKVWECDGVTAELRDTDLNSVKTVWIGVESMPSGDRVDTMVNVVVEQFANLHVKVILHIQHCETDDLHPPDWMQMMSIVAALMRNKEVIEKKLVGTILQAKNIDETVKAAKGMFDSVYQTHCRFDIVTTGTEVATFLEEVLEKRRQKERKREASQKSASTAKV